MRKILVFLLLLTVGAIADNISPSDMVTLVGRTILSDGNNAQPDSIRVMTYRAGSQVYDVWFNSSDAECYSADNALIFFDAFSDIDGAGGDGHYSVEIGAYGGGEAIYTYWYYDFTVGGLDVNVKEISGSEAAADSAEKTFLGTLASYSNYHSDGDTNQIQLTDSAGIVNGTWAVSSRTITGDTYTPDVNVTSLANNVITSASINDNALSKDEFSTNFYATIQDTMAMSADTYKADVSNLDVVVSSRSSHSPDEVWYNIDTSATIDTSDIGDWMIANLSGGDGVWNTIQRDSVLSVIRDSVFHYKVWHDSSDRTLTSPENITTTDGEIYVDGSGYVRGSLTSSAEASLVDAVWDEIIDASNHNTVNSSGKRLYDIDDDIDDKLTSRSSHSANDVADAVWDEDTTGHYNSGTYGYEALQGGSANVADSIPARIDSILVSLGYDESNSAHTKIDNLSLSGGGTEPETLIVMSTGDSTLIEGAVITIRTIDGSTVKVPGLATDVNGKRILELDADSFYVALSANNYVQTTDTLVVQSGGGTDTLFMTLFDSGDPADPDLCRVYGWVYDISGDSLSGIEVSAEIPRSYHPVKYSGIVITPFSKSTQTDSTGYWYIDLFPNLVLSDTTSKYLFTIKYHSGVIYRTEKAVPDSTSWQLE